MNPTAEVARQDVASVSASERDASLGTAISELVKARLTVMVLLTTLAGYFLARQGALDGLRLFHTLLGTALVAVCSSIFNQALERETDALMRRTEERPFVTRRLPLVATVLVGGLLGVLGLAELAWFVNLATSLLAALTLATYVVIYTPMKRLTTLNTFVGALPGALPPLLGATAAQGSPGVAGWTLFALLACWQLPHFYAIAWLYREDYRAAGLRMLSVGDTSGRRTGRYAALSAGVLVLVALLPTLLGSAGVVYGGVALVLSLAFLLAALRFARAPGRSTARGLFLASIIYLPLVLLALVVDRLL